MSFRLFFLDFSDSNGFCTRSSFDRKERCRGRITYLNDFDTDKIKRAATVRFIKPVAGIDMFLSRFFDNPYCDFCVERSPVGNDFAQMIMIARSELVFYDNRPVVGFGLDIDFEILGLGFRYWITDI